MPHRYHNLCLGAIALAAALLAAVAPSAKAAKTVQLAWDPSSDPDVVGYSVLYGTTSHDYTQALNAGGATSATLSGLSPGATYYVVVTAYNSASLQSVPSNEISFTVPPNVPPNVVLTSPRAGAILNGSAPISLGATADDPDGSVVKVEFYQGTTQIGQAARAPFAATWNNAPSGNFQLTALAYDDSGAAVRSTAVPVTVTGSAAGPAPSATPPMKMHIMAMTHAVKEGNTARFKVIASKTDPSQSTVVSYAVGGTAVSGVDYDPSGVTGQITISAGSRSALLQVNTIATPSTTNRKTISISMLPSTNYRLASGSAVIVIVDRSR